MINLLSPISFFDKNRIEVTDGSPYEKHFLQKAVLKCCRKIDNYSRISVQFQFPILEMGFLDILQEFAGGTSIHGFTFLVRPTSSIRTKIIWALCLVVAITYASVQMRLSVVGKYHYHYLLETKKNQPMIILNKFE